MNAERLREIAAGDVPVRDQLAAEQILATRELKGELAANRDALYMIRDRLGRLCEAVERKK